MCLIVFAWQPEQATVLRLAANRDEFYARPSAALGQWPDAPDVFAGRDLQAGGTWLGVTGQGRFAALTNIRDPRQKAAPRSRGALTADYLLGQESPAAYLDRVMRDAAEHAGFNLLVGDRQQLWHFNSQEGRPRQLESGVYGMSNANLDTPWPKLLRAREALSDRLDGKDEELLALLSDHSQPADHLLPDTGVGLATERLLSSVFIASEAYGTRASTVLNLGRDGGWSITERSFGPQGASLGEVALRG
ncbi:NRDE family protein [Ectopseudomonas composti]|uniref:NRDE family protein n=1 Tax=Ectopseudomonas composti TaxID=658457 RepID=UPI0007748B7C|nr:NRDE family protein [Pseudomonas composti]